MADNDRKKQPSAPDHAGVPDRAGVSDPAGGPLAATSHPAPPPRPCGTPPPAAPRPALLAIFVLLLAILLLGAISLSPARAQSVGDHDRGHAERHDWYRALRQPGSGMPCCNGVQQQPGGAVTGDCRPTRAFLGDDGVWRALVDGEWRLVPPRVVLDPAQSREPIYAHVCANEAGHIYCFLPAGSGI